ncbi:histidine acid phosphatase [Thraustotheca clavata]|uniref:Histidine acid phosphatase n=1 Tax=Thraustotheca clavata TaxID=74557 RepID=A0A1W0A668_9STRA|nr:histidine acid phosphatase [Thraustotheca clavata]
MSDVSDLELRHVLVAFRHGDRSPILPKLGRNICMDKAETQFWGDRLATPEQVATLDAMAKRAGMGTNDSAPNLAQLIGGKWPNGYLTQLGVEQMISKGQLLRDEYKEFLGTPSVNDISVRSTNVVRTIQSAQCVLLGMFPEFQVKRGESSIVSIHLHPSCPLSLGHQMDYHHLSTKLKSRRHESPVTDIDALEKEVKSIVGLDDNEDVQWSFLREILVCRQAHNFPFPKGLTAEMAAKCKLHNGWEWHAHLSNPNFLRNAFGRGVHEVFGYMKAATQGTSVHKMTILSGHDDTLCGLLHAFELEQPGIDILIPEYGSILRFNLLQSKSTGKWFIQAVFDGNDVHFKGTDKLCPFSHLEALIQLFPSQ